MFGCDTIMNLIFDANWNLIKQHKQKRISQIKAKENSKQTPHTYDVYDVALVKTNSHLSPAKMPVTGFGQSRKYNTTELLKSLKI